MRRSLPAFAQTISRSKCDCVDAIRRNLHACSTGIAIAFTRIASRNPSQRCAALKKLIENGGPDVYVVIINFHVRPDAEISEVIPPAFKHLHDPLDDYKILSASI